MKLEQIRPDSRPETYGLLEGSPTYLNFKMQAEYYSKIGFNPPWVGYLVIKNSVPAGMGAFKGKPIKNKVEIAYFIFPENEGQGLGTETCKALVDIARVSDPEVLIMARTLPEKNASTRILIKNGFEFSAAVQDPEDGEVWEWKYVLNQK